MGNTGAGKSTLIQMLLGYEHIYINGELALNK
jgi:ABC-type multidrug transport system ATPase subunit